MPASLPTEILYYIADVLRDDGDHVSLFNCALVNRRWAVMGLERLYQIHETSPHFCCRKSPYQSWRGWRSIIVSSFGGTEYPYCLWIRTLDLEKLENCLYYLKMCRARQRDDFFAPPLADFEAYTPGSDATRHGDLAKMVDKMMGFLTTESVKEGRNVAITCIRANEQVSARLAAWVAGLPRLRALEFDEASDLSGPVAEAIRASGAPLSKIRLRPNRGALTGGDEHLARSLAGLAPDTVQHVSFHSADNIGRRSLQALSNHAKSLLSLSFCHPGFDIRDLGLLGDCQNLTELNMGWPSAENETATDDDVNVASTWFKNCVSLKKLDFGLFPGTLGILTPFLMEADIKLTRLAAALPWTTPVLGRAFFSALGTQTELDGLYLDVSIPENTPMDHLARLADAACFGDAVCRATKLRSLSVSGITLDQGILARMAECLPALELLAFEGTSPISDEYLEALKDIRRLTRLQIGGVSSFSHAGLVSFVEALAADEHGRHTGIVIEVSLQQNLGGFSRPQKRSIIKMVKDTLGGELILDIDEDLDSDLDSEYEWGDRE